MLYESHILDVIWKLYNSVLDWVLSVQIVAFILTGVGDLLNGDAVSQIFGNHTTDLGAP